MTGRGRRGHPLLATVSVVCSAGAMVVGGSWLSFFGLSLIRLFGADPDLMRGQRLLVFLTDWAQRIPLWFLVAHGLVGMIASGLSFALAWPLERTGARTAGAAVVRRLARLGLALVLLELLGVGAMLAFRIYLWLT